MESKEYQFCPSCHLINRADAAICIHCGKPLGPLSEENLKTNTVDMETKFFPIDREENIDKVSREAPAEGIAVYVSDQTHPVEVCLENEFVIGRLTDATEVKVVDLTSYNANDLGVSRRHLLVRRAGKVYNVIDLNTTNGSWVNGQRLIPQLPFPITSGAQIRLGRMRIFLVFLQ